MTNLPPNHRKAAPDDAPFLAPLIDMAGEGVPMYLWAQMAEDGETPLEMGIKRAAREEGGFSYKNAIVRVEDGQVAGMLLGYTLPDPYDIGDINDIPEFLRPAVLLEQQAPGSWYINAIAVFSDHAGKGIGTGLMKLAEQLCREAGASELSLIVTEGNSRAKGLYDHLGYTEKTRMASVPVDGLDDHGDWILMVKKV